MKDGGCAVRGSMYHSKIEKKRRPCLLVEAAQQKRDLRTVHRVERLSTFPFALPEVRRHHSLIDQYNFL
jgi:hypothetical protein